MKRIITLLQILFLCVFIGCCAYFGKLYYEKTHTEKEMERLSELIDIPSTPETNSEESEDSAAERSPSEREAREENGMLSMYYKLYERNSDMAGWIKINGTKIDYPVLHNAESNAYYLHRGFDKEKSSPGMIFMDYQCDRDGGSDNTILYGHNMSSGTMFHSLLNYEDESFCKKYPLVEFDTMYEHGKFRVFAAFHTTVGSSGEFRYYDFIDAAASEEFEEYVSRCKSESIYDTGVTPAYGDKLLTLSTCSYNTNNERFVVAAVRSASQKIK